jgi:hypothetical protein
MTQNTCTHKHVAWPLPKSDAHILRCLSCDKTWDRLTIEPFVLRGEAWAKGVARFEAGEPVPEPLPPVEPGTPKWRPKLRDRGRRR